MAWYVWQLRKMTQEMKVQDICSEEHYKYMSGFDYNLHLPQPWKEAQS